MSHQQKLATLSIILLLSSAGAANPQTQVPEDQIKLGQKFYQAQAKCRGRLRSKQWKEAKLACQAAVRLADRFADYRELEKLEAYESVGHALMGLGRFAEAITFYARALEVARPRIDETNAETGQVYGSIALAYHALRKLDQAREFYGKAASTYRVAYTRIDPEADHGVEMRQGYLKCLQRILEYHLLAAEQAGDLAEVKEIKRQLEALSK